MVQGLQSGKTRRLGGAVLALCCGLLPVAQAAPSSQHKDWRVFTVREGGQRVCYAVTPAQETSPRSLDHGAVFAYVGVWSYSGGKAVPSFRVGYELRRVPAPTASVGRSTFTLFSAGREAFTEDRDDSRLVQAIEDGSSLRLETATKEGGRASYTFSLKGSSAAVDAARAACR